MFDYIFYRLYKLYKTKEKDSDVSTIFSATLYLSFLQYLLLLCIIMSTDAFVIAISETRYSFSTALFQTYPKPKAELAILILFVLWNIYNHFYYKKKYKELIVKYKNHPLNNKFKPWMLYFVAVGFIAFPIFLYKML